MSCVRFVLVSVSFFHFSFVTLDTHWLVSSPVFNWSVSLSSVFLWSSSDFVTWWLALFMCIPLCLSLLNEEETTTAAFRFYLLHFTIAVCNCDAIYYIYTFTDCHKSCSCTFICSPPEITRSLWTLAPH